MSHIPVLSKASRSNLFHHVHDWCHFVWRAEDHDAHLQDDCSERYRKQRAGLTLAFTTLQHGLLTGLPFSLEIEQDPRYGFDFIFPEPLPLIRVIAKSEAKVAVNARVLRDYIIRRGDPLIA